MTAKIIKKYSKKTVNSLIKLATTHFNRYIRKRDEGNGCISCDSHTFSDAGHYYSGGHYPSLKFNENNVSGQCKRCNHFLSGNLLEYRKKLIKKIGIKELEKLDFLAERYKQTGYKWDRFFLIEIIEKYKALNKKQ